MNRWDINIYGAEVLLHMVLAETDPAAPGGAPGIQGEGDGAQAQRDHLWHPDQGLELQGKTTEAQKLWDGMSEKCVMKPNELLFGGMIDSLMLIDELGNP